MNRRILLYLYPCLLTMVLITMPNQRALAQGNYPEPWDPYVSDYANVIDPEDEAKARTQLETLRQSTMSKSLS